MARADVDHDGKVNIQEFILMMYNNTLDNINKDDKVDEIKMAFRAFDTRGDGHVSIENVRLYLTSFTEGQFTDEEIGKIIKGFDENKNGYFEINEFVNFLSFVQYCN